MPAVATGVSFEVERFEWSEGRLLVVGRWYGVRGRRFLRPTLDVEAEEGPRRMLAVLEHKPWAADDGEEWTAAFQWEGEPADLAAVELAVAPELSVELPAPSGAPAPKARRRRPSKPRHEARPPRAQTLEAELAAARAEADELRSRLAAEERARAKRSKDLKELRLESAAMRDAVAAERDAAVAQRDAVVAERDAAVAEREAAVADREAAVAEREVALQQAAKSASERERAARERAALEGELASAIEARDKAREERNAWLTRARAAEDQKGAARAAAALGEEAAPSAEAKPAHETAPAPADEQLTAAIDPDPLPLAAEQRGRVRRRPAPAPLPPGGILMPRTGPGAGTRSIVPDWAPRVLVPVALVLLVVVVVLLIAWAF